MSKPCKYNCGLNLHWDTSSNSFKEEDGTAHSKERCAYIKSLNKAPSPAPTPQPAKTDNSAASKEMIDLLRALVIKQDRTNELLETIAKTLPLQHFAKASELPQQKPASEGGSA